MERWAASKGVKIPEGEKVINLISGMICDCIVTFNLVTNYFVVFFFANSFISLYSLFRFTFVRIVARWESECVCVFVTSFSCSDIGIIKKYPTDVEMLSFEGL